MQSGIHLLHKPVGPSSFSIVRDFMEAMPARPGHRPPRICHGGTLDPFASGLLLILIEPATRLFSYLHDIPKTYDASIRWGIETDNGDPTGNIVSTADPSALTPARLDEALAPFLGWHDQTPHPTSARRIAGERAYLKAHRGESVTMPPARVYLHAATWLSHDLPHASRLRLTVRGGYYIRALARDLGRHLGCGAHVSQLNRISIGPWSDPGPTHRVELHARDILPWCPVRLLSDQDIGDLRRSQPIPRGDLLPPDWLLPPGFPPAPVPIRGFHREKFCFLLSSHDDAHLRTIRPLTGGL